MSIARGDKLGPYEIGEAIGKGGMGEVWKARDTRLNRVVAIKRLAEGHSARFEQEARAIAALKHPHICTLYDIGSSPDGLRYLVMEFIDGRPLQGPQPAEEALRLMLQVARALEAAHAGGILHRDLKPGNVLITAEGAKLLDFGLAKLTADSEQDATQTIEGAVSGTAPYMSPEQARGEKVDARSDIFSFGAVLYELLSGRRAFTGSSNTEILSAVLRDDPPSLDAPADLARIIQKCLRKSRDDRYTSMAEVRAALERVNLEAKDKPSIAVLPFANFSADKDNEYFSDGLAEEILNALSQVEGLRVAARTSSFFFKGKHAELREIADKLQVANVLEGSVRRAGNRIRVTVQLVDVRNGFHLWSERYDRQMEDIFEVQDEISRAIAERLKVTLTTGVKRSTQNLEAYELYLKGRQYWHQRSLATIRMAIQCFEQTIQLDPQYAMAYAGLADCYGILCVYGWMPAEQARPLAHAAVTEAMRLAPALWEVNFSLGFYMFYLERNWRAAEPHFQKAIAINPHSALAQTYYGLFLGGAGRAEEASRLAASGCKLDPLSPIIHALASAACLVLGRYEAGVSLARQALDLQPEFHLALWMHGLNCSGLERDAEGVLSLERVVNLSRTPLFVGVLGLVYGRAGRREDATRLLNELQDRRSRGEYVPAFALLSVFVGLGDIAGMREMLARAAAETEPVFSIQITCGPFLEGFRNDPEIDRVLIELYGQ